VTGFGEDDPLVVVTSEPGPVTVLRLNRPAVHNALNAAVLDTLERAVTEIAADPRVRAVVVTGTGEKSFCAGADLAELEGLGPDDGVAAMSRGQRVLRAIEQLPVPVVAAVNGIALGGGFELVLACSFAVASERSSFGLPETGLGLIPGFGGTQRLARAVGAPVARHVITTGARLSAARAYDLGLLVVPPVPVADVLPAALALAGEVAARGPVATRSALRLVGSALDGPLDLGLAAETTAAGLAVSGRESTEGVEAFLGKRAPRFEVAEVDG
jgi:enoyl-CoA hydratase